jgi:hypothetical protein
VLPAEGALARWVVSAAGRAEREFFSDFADGPAAPPQARKTLRTAGGGRHSCVPELLAHELIHLAHGTVLAQFAKIDDGRKHHCNESD